MPISFVTISKLGLRYDACVNIEIPIPKRYQGKRLKHPERTGIESFVFSLFQCTTEV